jgi:hypothetical protein
MSANPQANIDGSQVRGRDGVVPTGDFTLRIPPPVSPKTNSGHLSPSPHVSGASHSPKNYIYPLLYSHGSDHRIQPQSTPSPQPSSLQVNAVPPLDSSLQAPITLSGQAGYLVNPPVSFLVDLSQTTQNQTIPPPITIITNLTSAAPSRHASTPALDLSESGVQEPIHKKLELNEPEPEKAPSHPLEVVIYNGPESKREGKESKARQARINRYLQTGASSSKL